MNRTAATLAVALTVTLVGGFVALSIAGVDTAAYVLFCAGPVVSTAVGFVLSHKVERVATVVEQVKHQTNGIAVAQNAAIEAHLSAQDRAAGEAAAAAEEHAQRVTQGAVEAPHVVPSDGP